MVARPHAHPELVEHLGEVVRVDVAERQGKHPAPVLARGRPEDPAVVAEALVEGASA